MSPNETNKRRDHERSDWNLTWVVGGGIALVISTAIMLLASWWIFKEFQSSAAARQLGTAMPPPIAPPEPRLQVSPNADWTAMLEKEQATLRSYGWVDRSKGIVRIPIEVEMQLIADRGFPTSPQGKQTK
jgi:hypothetical protein